jgi:exopolyphosphatase/guanosine-5'-triphosphate,3'-diphosphate pyrophosphatase
MRWAIIDLGTNTFNLLIAEKENGKTKIILNEKIAVKLGEGGINCGEIKPAAYKRGMNAVEELAQIAKERKVQKTIAFATSAIRSAVNGKQFAQEVKTKTGIGVKIINGQREASLIFNGVLNACPPGLQNALVMDIGGGSTEFIIGNNDGIFWKKSFPLGAARLLDKFKPSEPIKKREIISIENYLLEELKPLWNAIKKFECKLLIGSSGSFDTFAELILQAKKPAEFLGTKKSYNYSLIEYEIIHQQLLKKNKTERLKMPGMLEMRVDMIVLASIFCSLVLKNSGITKMKLSAYSLKEGAFFEIIKAKQQKLLP